MPTFANRDRDSRRRPRSSAVVLTAIAVVLALSAAACGASTAASPSAVASASAATPTPAPPPSAAPSDAPTAAPPSAAPDASPAASLSATGHIVVAEHGFALTLPDGWESLPVDAAKLKAFIAALPAGSQLRSVLEGQAASTIQQAIAFWAFDVRPEHAATGFARNINIIVQPPTTMDLATIQAAARASLEALAAIRKPVKSSIVKLPAGEALKLEYVVDVATAGAKSTSVAGTQYYIQLPKSTLIVSFSSDLASQPSAATDFDTIAKSIEAAP